MSARVIHLDVERSLRAAEQAPTIPCGPPGFAGVVNAHPGAVEIILGSPADDAGRELWLPPRDAEDFAHAILRCAKAAREAGR